MTHLGTLESGESLTVNVDSLVETRMLIQATSGGGKSWALRRLLEQTAKGVQQLVIDPEGEFQTLREKFDFVICAPHDADAIATPQTAGLLARRLLESGVSAILDIYDLKAHERQLFVQRFLESLLNAPKLLWHPVLIVLDEAHVFAPQAGGAEALGSVIDIATRGRKRGQCLVAATQRLSKLHKDVAAELMNKLIGRTGLDVDVKRAAEELGMSPQAATSALRQLDPGEFYCFGPAISRTVQKLTIGQVGTTHPKTGQRLMKAPPAPSKKILQTLAKLADLPTQAADEVKGLVDAKAVISRLQKEISQLREGAPAADAKRIEDLNAECNRLLGDNTELIQENAKFWKIIVGLNEAIGSIAGIADGRSNASIPNEAIRAAKELIENPKPKPSAPPMGGAVKSEGQRILDAGRPYKKTIQKETEAGRAAINGRSSNGNIDAPCQKILNAAAWWLSIGNDRPTRGQVAFVASYSAGGGTFKTYLSRLSTGGYIESSAGTVVLTDSGRAVAIAEEMPQTMEAYHQKLFLVVGEQPLIAIMKTVIAQRGNPTTAADVGAATGYEPGGGTFKTYLSRVSSLGLIERRQGQIFPTELLLPRGLS